MAGDTNGPYVGAAWEGSGGGGFRTGDPRVADMELRGRIPQGRWPAGRLTLVLAALVAVTGAPSTAPATAAVKTLTIRPLMLQPNTGGAPWTGAELGAAARAAARFWQTGTGGALRFRVLPVQTKTVAGLRRCDFRADQKLARSLFGIRTPQASTIYVVGNPLSNCKNLLGVGDFKGAWISVQRADPGIVAHELGHNLGLRHAGAADCPLPDGRFGLSIPNADCKVREYGDSDDIMGNNFDVQLRNVGLSAISLSILGIAQPTTASTGTYALQPLEASRASLAVQTSYGRAFIEYAIGHKGTLFGAANDHTVQVRIQPTSKSSAQIQSVQLWMYRDPTRTGDADGSYLYPGDQALIPGTTLQLRIGAMDASGADIAIASKSDPVPTAPAAPTQVRRTGTQVAFDVTLASDHSGFVFVVQTLSGPRMIGSIRGGATSWTIPAGLGIDGTIGVAAVTRAGAVSTVTWQSAGLGG